jgi:hypothetical protein
VDTQAFYAVIGGVGFTLLGLWQVVVTSRKDWQRSRPRRLLAYTVALHFLLPAMMSVLSMIAPDQPIVWRVVFAASGALGVAGVLLYRRALIEEYDVPRLAAVVGWAVLPVYVAIVILALVPTIPADLGLALGAIQVEAILVSLVLFLGVQASWIMLVEPPRAASGEATGEGGSAPRP